MSSRYQKQFSIPEGFPQLLKTFSREVLRCQPPNIYKFGARYFAQLVEARQAETQDAMGEEPTLYEMSPDELADFITDLFVEFDTDQNGHLDRKEFKAVMKTAKLGLSNKDIRAIMAEADEDGSGFIEYREFVPLMVDLITMLKAKEEAAMNRLDEEEAVREDVEYHLLHGIPKEELEEVMKRVFEAADENGNGELSMEEFRKCLKSAELGLTRKEINLLLSECDTNQDGAVSYNEFVPLCFNLLVERFKDQMLSNQALQGTDQLQMMLLDALEIEDADATGMLPLPVVKASLTRISQEVLGLTRLQLLAVLSEANPGADGLVDYRAFSGVAADMLYSLIDGEEQTQRIQAINQMAMTEGAELLHGLDMEMFKNVMRAAFEEADKDKSGYLDSVEILHVVEMMSTSSLALEPHEVTSLMAAVDTDQSGTVSYNELVDFFYEVLKHLNREKYVQDVRYSAQHAETAEA